MFLENEVQQSYYNFEYANTEYIKLNFDSCEKESTLLIDKNLEIPAYEKCIKASHYFNLLDARGVISVSERQAYILKVRNMSKTCCSEWIKRHEN